MDTENTTHGEKSLCLACHGRVATGSIFDSAREAGFCADCLARYPGALLKASFDSFDYALKLMTGEVIRFESAAIHGDYVSLTGSEIKCGESVFVGLPFPFPRGLEVRADQIVWCADAPEGS